MTEKRFYRNRGTIWENDKSMSLREVEDKLNALYDENEQLKQLNIPVYEIKDTIVDYKGRIIGVYYND